MKKHNTERPSVEQLEKELQRVSYRTRYKRVLKSTTYTLITVAAIAVLVATLWMPVLQIYGSSMNPTLQDGQIVFSVKTNNWEQGDILAFYYNNKVLIKRVIALPGDYVNITEDGSVYVNDTLLEEPYVAEPALGAADITFPYQVPEDSIFVLGDHRSTSVDSRHTALGCVTQEQIVGKVVFRIWPFSEINWL